MNTQAKLQQSLYVGFVNSEERGREEYKPKLLVNNHENGQKVLTSLIKELSGCDEFLFSVAFITQSGITVLLNALKELEERNIKGKIVSSQYLNFTDPKALSRILEFKNIELRMLVEGNLHAKGYIFKKQDTYSVIVGSSNLTQEALSYNKEWNMKVSSMNKGELLQEMLVEFEDTFERAERVDLQWIATYDEIYRRNKGRWINNSLPAPHHEDEFDIHCSEYTINEPDGKYGINTRPVRLVLPNKMQVAALAGIRDIREKGENKALLISATGTGKTYLAAFDVFEYNPKRFLFLVHREQILDQAIESFKNVLGHSINIGKLCGTSREIEAQYMFSTIQTMSKERSLAEFSPDAFDYIVIDESHRSGAESYQRILQHFKPSFLLGMTATPERTDDYNICQHFDYNIAYEIRLQQALQENMLCPFHYFGITELHVEGQEIKDNIEFRYLVSEERVKNIMKQIAFYGYHGKRVKGLVFCSRNDEAKELSNLFNQRGFRTVALSGADAQDQRDEQVRRLELDDGDSALDYIFTVDIFNEGIDIPSVNQIIMLRPTQSSIIFVQQLGRGLRKAAYKEYVIILDFIGNYQNNFMIPVALSGDRSYNKDTIRRYVAEGSRVIPGCSTISFDAVSKKRIYESIDNAKFNKLELIKESYQNLKYRLGRIPKLMDFEEHDSLDMARIFENSGLGSYYNYLVKHEPEYTMRLSVVEGKYIEFISQKLALGKRVHELVVISMILDGHDCLLSKMKECLEREYKIEVSEKTFTNVANVLLNEFPSGIGRKTFKDCIFIKKEGEDYKVSEQLEKLLKENPEFKEMIRELVAFGVYRNREYFGKRYGKSSFQLYQKYSYEDVCRLLEWEHNEVPLNIGGYKYDEKSKTYPVFINYEKADGIEASINYEDRFISPTELIALSKARRTATSNDVMTAYNAEKLGVSMELFVRKNKDDKISKEFYYFGKIHAVGEPMPVKMKITGDDAVEITYHLETQVREDLYEYLTEE